MSYKNTIDKERFCKLIDDYEEIMFQTALGILGNEEDAKNAIGETIIKAYKNLGKLKSMRKFQYWIMKILIKESNLIRKKRKRTV